MTARLVTHSPAGLFHRVRAPQSVGPPPTVILLHGRGGDENVMWVFERTLPARWLVVAPRAPTPDPGGGFVWHPRQPNEWPTLEMFDDAAETLAHFIHALPALYNADLNQLYLMGFSQGAALAYAAAFKHPALIKGIAGLVGFLPPGGEGRLNGLPIFLAIGQQDPLIPLELARASAEQLRQAGAEVDAREYDTGHKLDAAGMRDLKAWWERIHEETQRNTNE